MTLAELEALRMEITEVDKAILRLIARRIEIAREIGLAKNRDGLEVRDEAREQSVVNDAVARARELGVDDRTVATIMNALIEEAIRVQMMKGDGLLGGKRMIVVGAGRMGAWAARFASNRGAEVLVHDPRKTLEGYDNIDTLAGHAENADYIVVASPLGTARDDMTRLLAAKPSGVVFDMCSVKSHLKDLLVDAAAKGFRITSVHPMFGPGAITPRGRNVLLCSCGCPDADRDVRRLFEATGAKVKDVSLEEHDRLISRALGTPHLCALVFGKAIAGSGLRPQDLEAVEGPSFRTLGELASSVSKESRRVYHDIQRLNPHTDEAIEAIERAFHDLKKTAAESSPASFAKAMDEVEDYFGGWSR